MNTYDTFDGGYYLIKEDLIRSGIYQHHRHGAYVSDETLRTLNLLGATPKRINTFVLDILSECHRANDQIAGIPPALDPLLPGRKSDEEWESMSEDERADHKAAREDVRIQQASLASHRQQFLAKLSIARELRDAPAIYEPFFLDFRMRFYPMPDSLNSQSDDLAKALLMFASGKRLGSRGLYWLMVRAATCFGLDKASFDERYQWAVDHLAQIIEAAEDPLDGSRWWTEADEPWGFLATCHELRMATDLDDPSEFVSHLAIPMDGSCNGLQHLAAMGRDSVGGAAVNLLDSPVRGDVYVEVAQAVTAILQDAVTGGEPWAAEWLAVFSDINKGRKVVKRAVMTTPYGVTAAGIAAQLVSDGHVKMLDSYSTMSKPQRQEAARFMRDCINSALSKTISSAKTIMAWIQDCAKTMAEVNVPLRWKTPNGNTIAMAYTELARQKVVTVYGEQILWAENPRGGLRANKQAQGSAPNVIHSFDAAHLSLTVNALADKGIMDFMMIHDSYGVHACDTDAMAETLRSVFVAIYNSDVLTELHTFWQEDTGVRADLPHWSEYVALGDLNIDEVKRSQFFFS